MKPKKKRKVGKHFVSSYKEKTISLLACIKEVVKERDNGDIRRALICGVGKDRFYAFAEDRVCIWVNKFMNVDEFLDNVFNEIMEKDLWISPSFKVMIRHHGYLSKKTIVPFLEKYLTKEEKEEICDTWTRNLQILCAKLMGEPIDSKKKRTIEIENLNNMDVIFVSLCGIVVPFEVMLHIFSWIPNTREILDRISCVSSKLYMMSLNTWRELKIIRNVDMIPIPVLQGMKTAKVMGGSLLKKDFLTLFNHAKNLECLTVSIGTQHTESCLFKALCKSTSMPNLNTIDISTLSWMSMNPKVLPKVRHLIVRNPWNSNYTYWCCEPETVEMLKQLRHLTFLNNFTVMRKELKCLTKLLTLTLGYDYGWETNPKTWSFLKGYTNLETLEVVIEYDIDLTPFADVCVWLGKKFKIQNLTLVLKYFSFALCWNLKNMFQKIDKEAITINYEQADKDFKRITLVFEMDIYDSELKVFRENERLFKEREDEQKCFGNYKVVSKKVKGSYKRVEFVCVLK